MSGRNSDSGTPEPSANKTKDSVPVKPIELDDVLTNELGQFGRYQLLNILMVSFPIITCAFTQEYIFSAAAVAHRYLITYF